MTFGLVVILFIVTKASGGHKTFSFSFVGLCKKIVVKHIQYMSYIHKHCFEHKFLLILLILSTIVQLMHSEKI